MQLHSICLWTVFYETAALDLFLDYFLCDSVVPVEISQCASMADYAEILLFAANIICNAWSTGGRRNSVDVFYWPSGLLINSVILILPELSWVEDLRLSLRIHSSAFFGKLLPFVFLPTWRLSFRVYLWRWQLTWSIWFGFLNQGLLSFLPSLVIFLGQFWLGSPVAR